MRLLLACCLIVPALLAAPPAALAAGEGHTRVLRERYELTFRADSTYDEVIDYTIRANDQHGVNALGQQYLGYDSSRQRLEILLAETLPAHGAPVSVAKDDIKVQNGILDSTSLPDTKKLQVSFPKLAIGDAIHIRYRFSQDKLDLPGGISKAYTFTRDVIRDDAVVIVRYPLSLPLRFAARGVAAAASDATQDGWRRLEWRTSSTDTVRLDPVTMNEWKYTPSLTFSTFADWKAIADAYRQGEATKAIATPQVRALADEIVKTAAAPREQAALLYDWVRKNIRYVASYVGDGGWVPHDVEAILQTRYGDCKDHALLLQTLLAARGIDASTVLIQADYDNYVLPDLPDATLFNHAITFVPALNLYLDATDDLTPFGLLPETDLDKPVLVTRNFAAVTRTPAASVADFHYKRAVQLRIASDGSAVRTTTVTAFGRAAVSLQAELNSIGPGKQQDWLQQWFINGGLEATGSIEVLPSTQADVLGLRLTERIRNFLDQPEGGAIEFAVVPWPINFGYILKRYTEAQRSTDFKCEAFGTDDDITIVMPAAMRVVYLPKDVHLHAGDLGFDARFERSGNTYRLRRTLRLDSGKTWCAAAGYPAMREAMQRIQKTFGAQLLYVRKDAKKRPV